MKVLLASKDKKTYTVKEIIHIGYRNITSTVPGLCMQDYCGKWFYIPGVSKEECNRICEEIFIQMGCLDLRKYGKYFYF